MKKSLIGSVIRIPMDGGGFCYARILKDLDYVFYDYKTAFPDKDLLNITSKEILFSALVTFKTLKDSNWEVIGKLPLDERHNITPIYFHPDVTNASIAAYTIKKLEETLVYHSFENKGLQDGGIYSGEDIQLRLKDYYDGKGNRHIIGLIEMIHNLNC